MIHCVAPFLFGSSAVTDVPPRGADLAPIADDSMMLTIGLVVGVLLVALVWWRRGRTGTGSGGARGN
jgi:hypothetical protein